MKAQKNLCLLSKFLLGSFCLLTFSSCMTNRHVKAQEAKTDLAIREMHSEIEHHKHQLTKLEVQLQIIEGKNETQSNVTQNLRKEMNKLAQRENEVLNKTLVELEESLTDLQDSEDVLTTKLLHLEKEYQNILSYIKQHKNQIDDSENKLLDQVDRLEQIEHLLDLMQNNPKSELLFHTHIVQPDETLQQIADKYEVNLQVLMKLNELSSPHVISGQKLKLQ